MTVETPPTREAPEDPLLRIQAVADQVGLTPRSIRYYEEIGLIEPAARSDGAYRLYNADDVARLRFIKALRDETGFSLAEIGNLLEDESARVSIAARFRASSDTTERRALLHDGIARIDGQVRTLRAKIARIDEMIAAAEGRRAHLEAHLAELEPNATVRAHPEQLAARAPGKAADRSPDRAG